MVINRIKTLQGTGIFRQFTWPSTLQDFGRYNLVYGWNGTGKSTVTRILASLQHRAVPDGSVSLVIDGHDVAGSSFPTTAIPIRVFNREFVEKNVLASTQGTASSPEVPAIFVIGEKNVERQKEVDTAKTELQTLQAGLIAQRAKADENSRSLEDFCTERGRLIKELLTKTGSAYNNYNKASYKAKAEQLVKLGDPTKFALEDIAKAERVQQHQSTQRERLSRLVYQPPDFAKMFVDLQDLLRRVVTSAAIESLKTDSEGAAWIKDGLRIHKRRNVTSCLFCNQDIPAKRLEALNSHFNDAYQELLDDIEKRIQRVDQLLNDCNGLSIPKSTEVYEHLAARHKAASDALESFRTITRTSLAYVAKQLRHKQRAPFEAKLLDEQPPSLDAEAVKRVNEVIAEHNRHSDDFAKQVQKAREELEAAYVASSLEEFAKRQQAFRAAGAVVKATQDSTLALVPKIAKLERELVEHRKPADALNQDLRHYLGHGDIQLEISATGYKITRHGSVATRLSEGEQTAIALLYFLKTLTSKDFKLDEGIVVLDDPVCSLDANALFGAFGFIKERTKAAKQLFVLTHNFMFFRQVRAWFHKLKGPEKKTARFYMLRCVSVQGQRRSEICWLDPLLERYESDYHYIFSRVHELANGPPRDLNEYFGAPNLARKLMETFLAFHVPGPSGETVISKLEDISFDEHKKTRVLRFLNEYSHSNAIGGDQQDFTSFNETPDVLRDLLQMIEVADKRHYDGMISLMPKDAAAAAAVSN